MGLDMYIYTNSRTLTQKVHEDEPYGDYVTDFYKKRGIVLHWRKANAIHKWFVDNVQGGEDDCGIYEVEWEQLMELRNLCERVLEKHDEEYAGEWLPTCSGFFFGKEEIDEWYWDDLSWTVKEIDRIGSMLEDVPMHFWTAKMLPEEPDWCVTFYYHSSW